MNNIGVGTIINVSIGGVCELHRWQQEKRTFVTEKAIRRPRPELR